MTSIHYIHVDVFSRTPFSGNSLPVFLEAGNLTAEQMLRITQELRHFEAIYLQSTSEQRRWRARVFDLFEELPFAGHPLIGAAAVLHSQFGENETQTWWLQLCGREVSVVTERIGDSYFGLLDQGKPEFLETMENREPLARAFSLEPADISPELPMQVVSTGLRYLIMPVRPDALERAHISYDIGEVLSDVGAQFAVLLDEQGVEIRHWNNDGIIEDIATGSAAGTIGAYRLRHGLTRGGETFLLKQGRFTGRPSTLRVRPEGVPENVESVKVGGDVSFVGRGALEVLP